MQVPFSDAASPAITEAAVTGYLPMDDAWRTTLHDEVHARPPARIRLPVLITYVAVLNDGISRAQECAHLRGLPEQAALTEAALNDNFLRLRCGNFTH